MTPNRAARARVRVVASYERAFARDVQAWIARVYGLAADLVEHGRAKDALSVPAHHEGELLTRFVARVTAMAQEVGRLALDHLQSLKAAPDNAESAWLRRYSARRVAGIRKTTAQKIRRVLANGKRDGLSAEQIAEQLRKATRSKAVRQRALMIAQTELHQASERAALLAAKRSGMKLVKTWASMEDDRVRPAHAAADGQTVPQDKPFRVGGEKLMYPGDPAGSPANIINCRCVAVYSTAPLGLGLPRQWRPARRPQVAEPA